MQKTPDSFRNISSSNAKKKTVRRKNVYLFKVYIRDIPITTMISCQYLFIKFEHIKQIMF